jgi:hypothetical protein
MRANGQHPATFGSANGTDSTHPSRLACGPPLNHHSSEQTRSPSKPHVGEKYGASFAAYRLSGLAAARRACSTSGSSGPSGNAHDNTPAP